ncbi:MAG: EamA family transporter [Hyphomicrobiales bacterium]|nr:MAG: EamA family transporter [Hyphomicrobiales bacterium]
MSRTTANLLLLFAGAVWGMGFVAQRTAMDDIGPMAFIALRFFVASLAVLPLVLKELKPADKQVTASDLRGFFWVGTAFFLGMAMQQVGILATTITNAGFLTALYVIIVPLILFFALGERQPPVIWPATALALVGIFLLSGGEIALLTWGDWLIILGAFFAALQIILTKKVVDATGLPVTMAFTQFFICGIFGTIAYFLAPLFGLAETTVTYEVFLAALPEILYAGIFSGALAFTIQAVAQRYTSASSAAILLSSESLFAAIFAAILLGERLGLIGYLGCALIFAAILAVELMPAWQKQKSRSSL